MPERKGRKRRQPPHTGAADCHCPRCRITRAWRAGRFAGRRLGRPVRWDVWRPAEDAALRELAGQLPTAEIAVRLGARFGYQRTEVAIRLRLKRLGLTATLVHVNARGAGYLFGVDGHTILSWIRRGWLGARQIRPGVAGSSWIITAPDLERLITTRPEVYDWRAMPPSRWRSLAELTWRRDPLLTIDEASRILGVHYGTVARHLARGWLPGVRRLERAGHQQGRWLIRRSALSHFQLYRTERRSAVMRQAKAPAVTALGAARGTARLTGTCHRGHPRTIENTYVDPQGKRNCRVCRRQGIWYEPSAEVAS
jgi:hypothetical protein